MHSASNRGCISTITNRAPGLGSCSSRSPRWLGRQGLGKGLTKKERRMKEANSKSNTQGGQQLTSFKKNESVSRMETYGMLSQDERSPCVQRTVVHAKAVGIERNCPPAAARTAANIFIASAACLFSCCFHSGVWVVASISPARGFDDIEPRPFGP